MSTRGPETSTSSILNRKGLILLFTHTSAGHDFIFCPRTSAPCQSPEDVNGAFDEDKPDGITLHGKFFKDIIKGLLQELKNKSKREMLLRPYKKIKYLGITPVVLSGSSRTA